MDTIHCWAAIITVTALQLSSGVQGSVQTACTKTDADTSSVPLTCSSNQMIHVISELYGRRTSEDNCTVVRDVQLLFTDTGGLIVNCNGYTTCTEQTACGTKCNGTGHAFEIEFRCVDIDGSKDICSVSQQTGPLPTLYLHSPGFPNKSEIQESCQCTVSGQSLLVLLIQQRGNGHLSLILNGDDNSTWESNYVHFNREIETDARLVEVTYINHHNRTFWVRISGNITHTSCNSSSTPTTTKTTMISTETTTKLVTSSDTTPASSSDSTEMSTNISTIAYFSSSSIRGSSEEVTEDSTPYGTTLWRSTKPQDSRSDVILIAGAVSGGVILLIVLIIIVCVCRKKNVNTQAVKEHSDLQHSIQPETLSNMSTVIPNSCHSMNDPKRITQLCDNKIFEDNQELASMSDCMVDNELYHSKASCCFPNKGDVDDNHKDIETVANDLYHTHQADSKHNGGPRRSPQVNAKDHADIVADGEDVEVEDTQMAHGFHTLERDIARDGNTPVMIHDVGEDVMVTNDLYHSYRNPSIPQDTEAHAEPMKVSLDAKNREEVVMEENDLYHSYNSPELIQVPQDVRNREEMVMEDNDLYHSYRSREGNSIPEGAADQDEMVK